MEQNRRTSELWLPEFHPKQQIFYDSPATDILWGGDTRGGKTGGIKLSLIRWCSLIPGLQCDIFRLHLDDVIGSYMEGDFSFHSLLAQWEMDRLVVINQREVKFWNGSLISLEHCARDKVMFKHQGIPKHVRVLDESGQIPQRRQEWLTTWMTMSNEMKARIPAEWRGRFPKIIRLSNPTGPSKMYQRKQYVKARPYMAMEKVGAFIRQYIPARVDDNPSEDADATRARVLGTQDAATASALLNNNWDAQTGNYFSQWETDRHVIRPFAIPEHWTRFRTFDYGSFEPWACLWWAISDGRTVQLHQVDGSVVDKYIPRGALVCYREWYGCEDELDPRDEKTSTSRAPDKPYAWSNADIAKEIQRQTPNAYQKQQTFTDGFPFNDLGGFTIADAFEAAGLILERGDTDRKSGWSQMANKLTGERLVAGSEEQYPMIYFFDTCKYCIDYVPMIERNTDEGKLWDAQDKGEATHICDCVRLACMVNPLVTDEKSTRPEIREAQIKAQTEKKITIEGWLRKNGHDTL